MGIGVIEAFNFEPGGAAAAAPLMRERLPETRCWPGCEGVYLAVNEADADQLFLVQKWTSRGDYDRYREWVMGQPHMQRILSFLGGEMKTTYLKDSEG